MLVECSQCGAPLDVKDGDRLVRCSYCDATNRVRSMRTIAPQTPMQWQPPPQWTPPPQFPAPSHKPLQVHKVVPPKSGSPIVGCVIALVVIGAIAIPIAFSTGLVNEIPGIGIDTSGAPSVATIDLDATPAPPTVTGPTDTGIDASTISGEGTCRGNIPRQAQIVLTNTRPTSVSLSASSNFDIVMVLRRADGSFVCDDDSGGAWNPIIRTTLPPGSHRVYIGPFSDGSGTFSFDADSGGTAIMPDSPPANGVLVAGPGASPSGSYPGEAHGSIDIGPLGAGCRGYVRSAPTLAVQVTDPAIVRFVTRDIQQDLVMLLRNPDGTIRCDDDSGGALNPQIDAQLAPGTTTVWIGTLHSEQRSPFVLDIGAPATTSGRVAVPLNLNAPPVLGTVQLEDIDEVTTYDGVTEPRISATELDPRCRGFIRAEPDLVLNNSSAREVELSTSSSADLVMVIRGPNGTFVCDDDSGDSMNPQIHQRWGAGTHQVWVGSYSENQRSPFTLRLSEQSMATRRRIDHPIK